MSSREEHLKELVLQTQELYKEYVERGEQQERERIIKVAQLWISEMRGHDSAECNCRHEATVLENFINHPEFKGDNK
jgi:hypothetical protein